MCPKSVSERYERYERYLADRFGREETIRSLARIIHSPMNLKEAEHKKKQKQTN
ncbi:MAG: hypothetical protein WBP64_14905 [Nitrososphaeraceae archaeon]